MDFENLEEKIEKRKHASNPFSKEYTDFTLTEFEGDSVQEAVTNVSLRSELINQMSKKLSKEIEVMTKDIQKIPKKQQKIKDEEFIVKEDEDSSISNKKIKKEDEDEESEIVVDGYENYLSIQKMNVKLKGDEIFNQNVKSKKQVVIKKRLFSGDNLLDLEENDSVISDAVLNEFGEMFRLKVLLEDEKEKESEEKEEEETENKEKDEEKVENKINRGKYGFLDFNFYKIFPKTSGDELKEIYETQFGLEGKEKDKKKTKDDDEFSEDEEDDDFSEDEDDIKFENRLKSFANRGENDRMDESILDFPSGGDLPNFEMDEDEKKGNMEEDLHTKIDNEEELAENLKDDVKKRRLTLMKLESANDEIRTPSKKSKKSLKRRKKKKKEIVDFNPILFDITKEVTFQMKKVTKNSNRITYLKLLKNDEDSLIDEKENERFFLTQNERTEEECLALGVIKRATKVKKRGKVDFEMSLANPNIKNILKIKKNVQNFYGRYVYNPRGNLDGPEYEEIDAEEFDDDLELNGGGDVPMFDGYNDDFDGETEENEPKKSNDSIVKEIVEDLKDDKPKLKKRKTLIESLMQETRNRMKLRYSITRISSMMKNNFILGKEMDYGKIENKLVKKEANPKRIFMALLHTAHEQNTRNLDGNFKMRIVKENENEKKENVKIICFE